MRYQAAIAAAKLWAQAGGLREVELGALEPLLWRDGPLTIADLVRGLVTEAFRVTMTTNASLLEQHARALKDAGLSLLRVSWHTANPQQYKLISGFGDYSTFQAGLQTAAAAGLSLSFNRVLLRGHTDDIPEQIRFIERTRTRLKLYDLMWTPEIAQQYADFYQDWRPIVRQHVLPRTIRIDRAGRTAGRQRLLFHLSQGGAVEVKIGDNLDRTAHPCSTCAYKATCLEAFGDYVRVEPELRAHFCYLRRDISFDFATAVHHRSEGPAYLRAELERAVGKRTESILQSTPLRFILVPCCNYNCRLPGTNITWCHKTTGAYSFPGRPLPPTPTPVHASKVLVATEQAPHILATSENTKD
jgi:cyclic pyranopterin phosphate synthase